MDFNNIFALSKRNYIFDKPKHGSDVCILCQLGDDIYHPESLVFAERERTLACLNLFPYNAGHALIFPKEHVTNYLELDSDILLEIGIFSKEVISAVNELYHPTGWNIGWNLGEYAGASIAHLHEHLVPRYPNETGFIDLIAGSKVVVIDPKETRDNLRKYFSFDRR